MNIGLMVGIAAGIMMLTLIVGYAVCKYRVRRLGRTACRRRKTPSSSANDPSVTPETRLLSGVVADHERLKTTSTALLCRDLAPSSYRHAQKTLNGYDGDKRKVDVNEWYV